MPGSQGSVSLLVISTSKSRVIKSMSALLELWLSSLARKYCKDLQGQRGEAVPSGWEKQRPQTDSEPLLNIPRDRGCRIYVPCSWYLWSWTDTHNTSSSPQLWKELLPNWSGKKGEVATFPTGPVNYPKICFPGMCCAWGVAHLWWHNRLHRDRGSVSRPDF